MRTLADALSDPSFQGWLTGVIDRVAIAADIGEFQWLLHDATQRLGAERSLFANITGDLPNRSHTFVLGGDPGWWHRRRALVAPSDDPWLVGVLRCSTPALASKTTSQTAVQNCFVAAASISGFASALLIPTHSAHSESRVSVLCLGHSSVDYFEGSVLPSLVARARGLAVEMHQWWRRQDQERLAASVQLSAPELDLLMHHCAGLRSKQIARMLGISSEAVDSRFQRIIVKLRVRSRGTAARIAMDCGLIST